MNVLKYSQVFTQIQVLSQRIPVENNGNENSPIDHLLYMVSLRLNRIDEGNFGNGHFSSGIFIGRTAALTVATCFHQK